MDLTNLDQPLFDDADATKRDLVDYLDAVSDRLIAEVRDRPLSVIRVHRGQEAFMQKNVPKYAPDFVQTVRFWAETSKREVAYALCNDRRTLLWFGNQRAVEYHPTLVLRRRARARHAPRARPRPARGRRVRRRGARGPAGPRGPRRRRAARRGEDERGQGRARLRARRGGASLEDAAAATAPSPRGPRRSTRTSPRRRS